MNCQKCGRELPDAPVFIVEVEDNGEPPLYLRDAQIFDMKGRLIVEFLMRTQTSIENDCHQFANVEGVNLHFHYNRPKLTYPKR